MWIVNEFLILFSSMFKLYKFATMLKNSPNIGTGTITIENDPRVLPFGHFLRKSKINELPQLINILLGDMSVIGPRPLTPENNNLYSENVKDKLAKVRPGLSGVGSIIFRDEESSSENLRLFWLITGGLDGGFTREAGEWNAEDALLLVTVGLMF